MKTTLKRHLYIHFVTVFIENSWTDPSTEFADCTTGEVRLTDFSDNSEEDSRQGTIQICVNNAWGSVCSDHFFDNTDAAVFCGQLPGFKTDGSIISIHFVNFTDTFSQEQVSFSQLH